MVKFENQMAYSLSLPSHRREKLFCLRQRTLSEIYNIVIPSTIPLKTAHKVIDTDLKKKKKKSSKD